MNALYNHIKNHIERRGVNNPVFIFDYDGTLSNGEHRLHALPTENLHLTESWHEFNALSEFDAPFEDTIQVMRACYQVGTVIILTGRSDSVIDISVKWLVDNGADHYDFLVMRESSDNRKDTVIKEEFLRFIGLHRITAAWDDSPKVIEHFRNLGVTTYQVCDYGDKLHAHLQSHGVKDKGAECDHIWEMSDYHQTCKSCGKQEDFE